MPLSDILGYISVTKIFGIIPLDIITHIVFGALITLIGIKFKLRLRTIFLIIAIPTLIKEYFDLKVLNYPIYEPIKDIFVTYLFFILILFRKFWRRPKNS